MTPLDESDVRRAVKVLVDQGVEAVAVCLLWPFRESRHQRRVAEIVGEMAPHLYPSICSELAPLLREYERSATTVLNAYLGPKVRGYMTKLDTSLRDRGLKGTLRILASGGVI